MERRFGRMVAGVVLVLHGLAHALPGMQIGAGTYARLLSRLGNSLIVWTFTLLWSVAMSGFVAAGFGRIGAAAFRAHWRGIATVAAVASLGLLLVWPTVWTVPGIVVDVAILTRVRGWDTGCRRIIYTARALAADRGGDL